MQDHFPICWGLEIVNERHGHNVLTPPPKMPLWLLFLLQFTNILMVLLMAIGLVAFVFYCTDPSGWRNLLIALVLWFTVFITCYETFSQEAKSDELMEKFRAMIPAQCTVTRDGVQKKMSATDIVPGDVIKISNGDKIPADCRVIFSQSLKVDQSMITGESEPIDVSVDSKNQNALESKNIIFNGSLCVDGTCLAVAIRTGDDTLAQTTGALLDGLAARVKGFPFELQ
jgi:sodium/potassium-transporting ATPase subunit alpha